MFRGPAGNFFKVPNVRTPYTGDMPSPLSPGSKVFVRVSVNNNPQEFTINLLTDNGIAFHFNPRQFSNNVVRNSEFHGSWGEEEKSDGMPFQENNSYGIEINVDHEKYSVIVEGNHVCDFQHRCPVSEVGFIEVKGDIEVQDIIFSSMPMGGANFGGYQAPMQDTFSRPGNDFFKVEDPKTPYSGDIPFGLTNGKKVFVKAKLDKKCKEFKINLETVDGITFHFNPRLFSDNIVMNSYFGGVWGDEVKYDDMPFKHKKTYDIEITTHMDRFSVNIDGKHLCDFEHRCAIHEVTHISIEGDLEIEGIIFSM